MTSLVTIIIPTYNRAHLISETLDSILDQTYQNWECVITDDGSTDNSHELIQEYVNRDSRFKLFIRPASRLKGANACRNIGLENAHGEYIVFFDSDDLMTADHLEVKVEAIQKFNCDYVITKTQSFNYSNDGINKYYQFDKFLITPYNYVTQKINWLTYDICLKNSVAKSISFNENLQSGQEYNYFSKLVHISTNGKFIDKVVTLRRYHDDSIRNQLKANDTLNDSFFKVNWYNYLDLKFIAEKNVINYFMDKCIDFSYEMKCIPISTKFKFIKEVFINYGIKGFYFIFMIVNLKLFNKGYYFRHRLLDR